MKVLTNHEMSTRIRHYYESRTASTWIRINEIELLASLGTNYQELKMPDYIESLMNKIYFKMDIKND